ncbi:MAG: hypothetical protein IJE59_00290 [Clostridia bacterium]|nr:hypothetical protein [Clostridia bacterium]
MEQKNQEVEQRKEYKKESTLVCKRKLREKFEEEFRLQGLQAKYHFYKIENRDILIKCIARNELETEYLETNYNKILNEIIKKYELDKEYQKNRNKEIAEEYVEKMKPIWEEERKKQEMKNVRNNILLFILKIFEHPFILLSLTILGIFVWMFMDAFSFGFFKAVGFSIIMFIVLVGIFFRLYKIKSYTA